MTLDIQLQNLRAYNFCSWGIGDPTGGSPTAEFGNPRPPILCAGELRSLTIGPCEASVGCLGQLGILDLTLSIPSGALYMYMTLRINMPVWLMKMVLALHI